MPMTVAPEPIDPTTDALQHALDLADRLSGDIILIPISDGNPDWLHCTWQTIASVDAKTGVEQQDVQRLAISIDGFHRFTTEPAWATRLVVWLGGDAPEVMQIEGDPSPAAISLVHQALETGGRLREIRRDLQEAVLAAHDEDIAESLAEARAEARRIGERARQIAEGVRLPLKAANDNSPNTVKTPLLIASGDFVRGFVPPDYLIDGIMQSGFLYSLTGQTGAGKTAVALLLAANTAIGEPFAGRETKQGRVFYFAGENPDDVTMRWIGLCHALRLDANDLDVHFIRGVFDIDEFLDHIRAEADRLGGVGLIVVDTTAAYFLGTDENSNVEMGKYARLLRELAQLPWRPAVLAASHPVKNAAADNLLPRGGGAFLNELDGNLTLAKRGESSALHWQGKHRGPDFAPLLFDMRAVTAPDLVDSRGRDIPTVLAVPVGEAEVAQRADAGSRDDELMLFAIRQNGNRSLRDLAEALGWEDESGEPDKGRAHNSTDRLKRAHFITYELRAWKLTKKGTSAVGDAAQERHQHAAANAEGLAFVERNRGKRSGRRGAGATNTRSTLRSGEND